MPENPLLPNAKLRQLYTTMLRAHGSATKRAAGLEAIFAAVTQLLEPGDAVVSSDHGDALAGLLLAPGRRAPAPRSLSSGSNPLAFAAGVAAGAQVAGASGLVASLLPTHGLEANWVAVLGQAQADRLPLIVICTDSSAAATGSSAGSGGLNWQTLNTVLRKLRFPLLTVDGADAVAMYRAMQESVLRARHGDGPALVWCVMPKTAARPKDRSLAPLARLEGYLAARRISLPRVPATTPTGTRRSVSARGGK